MTEYLTYDEMTDEQRRKLVDVAIASGKCGGAVSRAEVAGALRPEPNRATVEIRRPGLNDSVLVLVDVGKWGAIAGSEWLRLHLDPKSTGLVLVDAPVWTTQ